MLEEDIDIIEEEQLLTDDKEPLYKRGKLFYIQDTEQEKRITQCILTEYEYSECIGLRASLIERGGKIFCDYTGLTNPIDIAKKEFKEKKAPLVLVRRIRDVNNNRIVEKWHLSKMSCFE